MLQKDLVDCSQFFYQLLWEECDELKREGIKVEDIPIFDDGYLCRLNIEEIRRVFDNLFSNLKKYADPNIPIAITGGYREDYICIIFKNIKRKSKVNTLSHKIGLKSMKELIEKNEGFLDIHQTVTTYEMEIRFKVKHHVNWYDNKNP